MASMYLRRKDTRFVDEDVQFNLRDDRSHSSSSCEGGGWDQSLAGCGDLLYMIVPHAFHARVTARSARRSRPVNGEAVASVVDAHVVELGTGADSLPRPVDIGHVRARLVWPATTEGWEGSI